MLKGLTTCLSKSVTFKNKIKQRIAEIIQAQGVFRSAPTTK
jgi:hypothetical protein